MRIYNPQNQLGEKLIAASAVKGLVKSHLTLAERVGDSVLCAKAASTAVAMFPDDEEVKYSTCETVQDLQDAGFVVPTEPTTFEQHLTMLKDIHTSSGTQGAFFSNWSAWNTDLPCLETNIDSAGYGSSVFANGPLASFTGQLPGLKIGLTLFANATGLTEWKNDLPNLANGIGMFQNCSSLGTFEGTLPSLLSGELMFDGCTNLSIASLLYIAQNINDLSGLSWSSDMQTKYNIQENQFGVITISMAVPTEAALLATYNEACMVFGQKGWTVVNTASA